METGNGPKYTHIKLTLSKISSHGFYTALSSIYSFSDIYNKHYHYLPALGFLTFLNTELFLTLIDFAFLKCDGLVLLFTHINLADRLPQDANRIFGRGTMNLLDIFCNILFLFIYI
jgi:hypothetical protein